MAVEKSQQSAPSRVAILRILFGLIWVVDASFKAHDSFPREFLGHIYHAAEGQPSWLDPWFSFWGHLFASNPEFFASLVFIIESLIALALLFGLGRRLLYLGGAFFSFFIWAIPEGFGGPYTAASTDIGGAIIYVIAFLALFALERSIKPARWAVDTYVVKKLPWWAIVANP